jgi:DNA repair protein RAD16
MGKTIQTIALILSDYEKDVRKCTLVLAPTVALIQWKNEIQKFTTGIKVLVFHGASRIDNTKEMMEYDVVLTSYGIMESSFRREIKGFLKKGVLHKEDSLIHKMKWHRVILDECHAIKDRGSNQAKAAFALTSKYKWALSGTPLQNRVGELYSLIRFLGADPFAYYFCKKCDCKSLHWLSNKGPCSVSLHQPSLSSADPNLITNSQACSHSGMQHVCYVSHFFTSLLPHC